MPNLIQVGGFLYNDRIGDHEVLRSNKPVFK